MTGIRVTKHKGFAQASMGIYWKRKYRGKVESERSKGWLPCKGSLHPSPWYLLTNLPTIEESVKAYKKRVGIVGVACPQGIAMFKDCQTGGYNLESSKASIERLTRLVLLVAIAYSCSSFKGKLIKSIGQVKYIGRQRKVNKLDTNNSSAGQARPCKGRETLAARSFWIGLYGEIWTLKDEFVNDWVEELRRITPHKLRFYQKGMRAKTLIQQAF